MGRVLWKCCPVAYQWLRYKTQTKFSALLLLTKSRCLIWAQNWICYPKKYTVNVQRPLSCSHRSLAKSCSPSGMLAVTIYLVGENVRLVAIGQVVLTTGNHIKSPPQRGQALSGSQWGWYERARISITAKFVHAIMCTKRKAFFSLPEWLLYKISIT